LSGRGRMAPQKSVQDYAEVMAENAITKLLR
jgi:hypothetical protein